MTGKDWLEYIISPFFGALLAFVFSWILVKLSARQHNPRMTYDALINDASDDDFYVNYLDVIDKMDFPKDLLYYKRMTTVLKYLKKVVISVRKKGVKRVTINNQEYKITLSINTEHLVKKYDSVEAFMDSILFLNWDIEIKYRAKDKKNKKKLTMNSIDGKFESHESQIKIFDYDPKKGLKNIMSIKTINRAVSENIDFFIDKLKNGTFVL